MDLPERLSSNRPFLWYAASFGVSSIAFWGFFLALLAQATYVYKAESSQLAILFAIWSMVFLLLVAPSGMVTDRWSPKWMIAIAQLLAVLSVLPALWSRSIAWLYVASVIDGIGAALAIPARGSLVALLVPQEALVRANGFLNTASMVAVIFGPGAAGLLARHASQKLAYWAIIWLLVAGFVLLLGTPDRRPRRGAREGPLREVSEGFGVAWREPELRSLLFLACTAWVTLTVFVALEPLFVKDVLHRGEDGLGLFWSTNGIGSFGGAFVLARSRRASGREVLLISVSLVVAGVGFLVFAGTSMFLLAVVGNVAMGVGFAWFLSLSQALIQRVAAEEMRGRVTGVMGMLQESSSVVCSATIAILGGLVLVRPWLVISAAVLMMGGVLGIRAAGRIRLEVQAEP